MSEQLELSSPIQLHTVRFPNLHITLMCSRESSVLLIRPSNLSQTFILMCLHNKTVQSAEKDTAQSVSRKINFYCCKCNWIVLEIQVKICLIRLVSVTRKTMSAQITFLCVTFYGHQRTKQGKYVFFMWPYVLSGQHQRNVRFSYTSLHNFLGKMEEKLNQNTKMCLRQTEISRRCGIPIKIAQWPSVSKS